MITLRRAGFATLAVAAFGIFGALSAGAADAATLDVCSTCTFTTIQSAINAANPGDTISIAAGTYNEALKVDVSVTLQGAGTGLTTITSPANLTTAFTTNAAQDPVVYADAPNVTIEDLTVNGEDEGNNNYRFDGIAEDNDTLTVHDVDVVGVSDNPLDGDQTGDAIYAANDTDATNTVTITGSKISGYQKNGIAVDANEFETVDISGNTVQGAGSTDQIGQNGIEVYNQWWNGDDANGPSGTVSDNVVSGDSCTVDYPTICGPDLLDDIGGSGNFDNDAAGLLFGSVGSLAVSGNTVTDSDTGIYAYTDPTGTATITGNTVDDNLYADVELDEGTEAISGNTIAGGPDSNADLAGVLIANYDGDTYPTDATVTGNSISGANDGVEVADGETAGFDTIDAALEFNAISGNTTGIANATTNAVTATNNWFGCNAGPGSAGCDTVSDSGGGAVTDTPNLVLDVAASPNALTTGQAASVTASLRQNSSGTPFTTGTFPSGLAVSFATTAGSVGTSATLEDGTATTALLGTPAGTATVTGGVDNQTATAAVTTTAASNLSPPHTAPVLAFLVSGTLHLTSAGDGAVFALFCADGCHATVSAKIKLTEHSGKVKTLTLASKQIDVSAGASRIYRVTLTKAERTLVHDAAKAKITITDAAKDDSTGDTTTVVRSFTLKLA